MEEQPKTIHFAPDSVEIKLLKPVETVYGLFPAGSVFVVSQSQAEQMAAEHLAVIIGKPVEHAVNATVTEKRHGA